MRVLIVGGTLFFGRELVELLLAGGHEVTVFTRGHTRPPFWAAAPAAGAVQCLVGDRNDSASLARALAGKSFDVVVDNLAYTARDVLEALEIVRGKAGRYVLTGAAAVYVAAQAAEPFMEEDVRHAHITHIPEVPWLRADEQHEARQYLQGKLGAERALLEQDALPFTLIRAPVIVGPKDPMAVLQFYIERIRDGGPVLLTDGGLRAARPITPRGLAQGFMLALTNDAAVNRVYNMAQERLTSLVAILRRVAEVLGMAPRFVNVPSEILAAAKFDYREPWRLQHASVMDIARARAELGFSCTSSVDEALEETVQWYVAELRAPASPGYEARAQELALARHLEAAAGCLQNPAESRLMHRIPGAY